ncbi:AI-2E family transporter [Anaerolentibacter hominis]|uniref:AI-2E family transporter n=1 Tax=Anaerolentibacter hominis TaxID=3079009 RepID=UPI0031B888DE
MVGPILCGFVLAYLLYPVVRKLAVRLSKTKIKILHGRDKLCKGCAVFLVYLAALFVIVLVTYIIIRYVAGSMDSFRMENVMDFCNKCYDGFCSKVMEIQKSAGITLVKQTDLDEIYNNLSGMGTGFVQKITERPAYSLQSLSRFAGSCVISVVLSVYFMVEEDKIREYLNRIMNAFFSRRVCDHMKGAVSDADRVFSGYIRGQLLDVAIMTVTISLILAVVGLPMSIVIGVLAGLGNLIPYAGPFIAYLGTALVGLMTGEYQKMIIALILLVVVQAIDGNYVNPKLLSNAIRVHPLLVVVSLLVGNAVGGLLGMLTAVPIGAFLKVRFDRFVEGRLVKKGLMNKEE